MKKLIAFLDENNQDEKEKNNQKSIRYVSSLEAAIAI